MIDWDTLVVSPLVRTFGQPAQVTTASQVVSLTGVFDEAYAQVDVVDGMPVTTVSPCLGVSVPDLQLPAGAPVSSLQGARVTVYAATAPGAAPPVDTDYIVREGRADGHGGARLMLNIAPTTADDTGAGQDA